MNITHSHVFDRPGQIQRKPSYSLSGYSNPFAKYFGKFLSAILRKEFKRLIFLSTLFAGIKEVSEPNKETLERLNKIFNLCDVQEAIALPICLGNNMWNKRLPDGLYLMHRPQPVLHLCDIDDDMCNDAEMRIIATTIISVTPAWLLYDSKRAMREDIVTLFKSMKSFEHDFQKTT